MSRSPIEVTACTFNNEDYPPRELHLLNTDDYTVQREVDPDLFMGQEYWGVNQRGWRKIWSPKRGFARFSPWSFFGLDGTVVAHRWPLWHTLDTFRFRLHGNVWGVSGRRSMTGCVVRHRKTGRTLTYISAHNCVSAWSDRFKDGSRRKRRAQDAWWLGMRTLLGFATRQATARDYVVIGIDANASAARVRAVFGDTIAGKPVQVFTSEATDIDHLVVIGHFIATDQGNGHATSDHAPFWIEGVLL